MGRLISNSAAGRRFYRHFTADPISCAGGGLFYDSYAFYAGSPVPGYGACPDETKEWGKWSVTFSDFDCIHGHPCRYGESCGCCSGYFCRWCGCCFLDVDHGGLGSATAFIEATLAQLYKEKDPLYGGYRGGPAYYIHRFFERKEGRKKRYVLPAVLFAISGLICWCGISQVISNSVSESFNNAFNIPPLYTTIALVILAAVIVLRKNATVKVLDVLVPVMAVLYFVITLIIIGMNITALPGVFQRIFEEAFGIRQFAGGSFGAILMNGVKRGLFSNEAGSGSAPCAAAAAEGKTPVTMGLVQSLGVFIDTIVICSCTAFIMLLVPQEVTDGLSGMALLQTAMEFHLGRFGVIFIAVTLAMFSFSTFLGILFYARSNVAYLFGDKWCWQMAYKVLALVMLFIGGIAAYTFVWDLGDVGIGLMTLFNISILYPLSKEAFQALGQYEKKKAEK